MRKLQILFPEPQLRRLRQYAKSQDRPVSELVRIAVDAWLTRQGAEETVVAEAPPVYRCGKVNTDASDLRDAAYDDRSHV
jgi:hypothetical protein